MKNLLPAVFLFCLVNFYGGKYNEGQYEKKKNGRNRMREKMKQLANYYKPYRFLFWSDMVV
ncbi:MAG: hypothetical protein EGR04_06850, partial [Blautia sp.]|nr:hypothetical protein [Blautia sp.]